jgi:hypothetical protein
MRLLCNERGICFNLLDKRVEEIPARGSAVKLSLSTHWQNSSRPGVFAVNISHLYKGLFE